MNLINDIIFGFLSFAVLVGVGQLVLVAASKMSEIISTVKEFFSELSGW